MDRRSFLHSTATAGAGLMLSPAALARADAADKRDINLALLGAGAQGEVLLNAVLKMGTDARIRFKAVCDIWENLSLQRVVGLLSRFGREARGYVDYREMLDAEKQLDAVLIATPDFWHARQAAACLEAGLHVYCESPMSDTMAGARDMAAAARRTGKLLQIGHQRRSNPRYVHCRGKLLKTAGLLGRLTAVSAQWNRPARADRGWSKRRVIDPATLERYGYKSMHQFKNWMWYKGLGAGPVVDFGAHQIDVINWFLGATPKSVTARGGTYYYDPKTHEWCDTVMAILEYETTPGTVAVSYENLSTNGYGGHVEVFMGDQGTLELSELPSRGGVYRDAEAPDWDKWVRLGFLNRPGMPEEKEDAPGTIMVAETKPPSKYEIPVTLTDPYHQPHLRNFFDAIRGRARLASPPETALAATATALAINEAVAQKKTVEFDADSFRA
ncbi:MAG: Gfo/Idh/MocA family oxidoreductase [Sedimentisphaerales bacterium]|nr:Gfo/Idh/MocA family oxidoreductase [Sedimentisphaerales bacterium]